jgi:hypothetical protein
VAGLRSKWCCGKPAHPKPFENSQKTDDFSLLGAFDDLSESASFLESTSARRHNVATQVSVVSKMAATAQRDVEKNGGERRIILS